MAVTPDTDFYSAFLHELNQPLTTVRNVLELTTYRECNDWDAVVESSLASVDRMAELLELMGELVRFERITSPELAPVDMAALLRELTADIGELASASGRTLDAQIEPAAAVIMAAPANLRQAVFRVLGDAVHHAREAQAVTVRLESVDETVTVRITYPEASFAANESNGLLALGRTGRGPRGGLTRRVFRLALALRILTHLGADLQFQNSGASSVLSITFRTLNSASANL